MSYVSNLFGTVSVPAVWGFIFKFFDRWDAKLPADSRTALRNWLANPHHKATETEWSKTYPSLIDHLFGAKPTSLGFFARSCIASIIAFAVVFALYAWATRTSLEAITEGWLFLAFATVNLIPDYISLLTSRLIIVKLAERPTATRAIVLLLLHVALTLASATAVIFVIAGLLHILGGGPNPWQGAVESTTSFYNDRPLPFWSSSGIPYGIFFYTSFFAAMWVWLYLVGGVIIKCIPTVERLRGLLEKIVNLKDGDIKDHPLRAIGWAVASMVAIFLSAFLIITKAAQ